MSAAFPRSSENEPEWGLSQNFRADAMVVGLAEIFLDKCAELKTAWAWTMPVEFTETDRNSAVGVERGDAELK